MKKQSFEVLMEYLIRACLKSLRCVRYNTGEVKMYVYTSIFVRAVDGVPEAKALENQNFDFLVQKK